ncbi:Uncharacterized protein APZ42_002178, partial [Daphnia magna]
KSPYNMVMQEVLEMKKDPLKEWAPRGIRTAFRCCIAGPTSPAAVAQLQCKLLFMHPHPAKIMYKCNWSLSTHRVLLYGIVTLQPKTKQTKSAPAIKPPEFSIEHLFFTGLSFLYRLVQNWPANGDVKQGIDETENPEVQCRRRVGATLHIYDSIDGLTTYTSRHPFLVGVVGCVKCFISNARKDKTHCEFGKLLEAEVKKAETELFGHTQMSAFPEDFSNLNEEKRLYPGSSLIDLTPFINHRGVLRVGGRIDNAPTPLPATFRKLAQALIVKLCQMPTNGINLVFYTTKTPSIKDMASDQRNDSRTEVYGEKVVLIGAERTCFMYKVNNEKVIKQEDHELSCPQHEEADTKMLVHVASVPCPTTVVIQTSNRDVLVIALGNSSKFPDCKMYLEIGHQRNNKIRLIDIMSLSLKLSSG